MKNLWIARNNEIEFWENEPTNPPCILDEERMTQLEQKVLEWLKDDNGDSTITFTATYYDQDWEARQHNMMFVRAEINIKSCYNAWEVWRIATSPTFNKIVSHRVKHIGTNDCQKIRDGFKMPNEVRDAIYGSDHQNEPTES